MALMIVNDYYVIDRNKTSTTRESSRPKHFCTAIIDVPPNAKALPKVTMPSVEVVGQNVVGKIQHHLATEVLTASLVKYTTTYLEEWEDVLSP